MNPNNLIPPNQNPGQQEPVPPPAGFASAANNLPTGNTPLFAADTQVPQLPPVSKAPKSSKPLVRVLIIVSFVTAVVVTGGLAYVMGSSAGEKEGTAKTVEVTPTVPQPATRIMIEQTSNSIEQDLSSINDEADFPANELSDDSLKL